MYSNVNLKKNKSCSVDITYVYIENTFKIFYLFETVFRDHNISA